jgi:omega-amidase
MIVALCQLNIVWEDKKANHERTRKLVAAAKLPKGALLVLPEMFSTGFSRIQFQHCGNGGGLRA